ncbi:hypothetical protein FPHYL_9653 [Fusarium phyllophilum]|uniref:Major facilitator superfamily (MFS) profile domain-containing protein n=1 Tax=Fusarium phyllophilum TaxID=47803 RepID=A0A8H5N2H9_9HYPO|nr:hypothetical protein FPHYL_9653 [Fusarium phyllophilum]
MMADHSSEKRPDFAIDSAPQNTALTSSGQEKIVPGDVFDNEKSCHPLSSDNRPEENISSNDDGSGDAESVDSKDELRLSKARCIALVCTVTGASFLNTLASQSVVIILPQIGRALDVPDTRLQWVVSSYVLTFGCFLLLWGRIADIYGKRLIFILGSFWVTICCVVNAFIPTEIAFDLFRGLHGLGAAANVPTAIGILGTTFPPGKAKNYAFSAYAAGAPLGSVCGNLVSGLIAEWASWKWVFGALAIMAGMIAVAGVFCIPSPAPELRPEHNNLRPKTAAVDWIGATLITCGLLALMFALTEGNVVGWTAPWIPVLIVVSFGVIVAFFFWQRYLEQKTNRPPLVKVSIFNNWRFTAVMIIMGFFFGGFNNYLIYATYYFQDYQGLSPLQTMLRFIPTGVSGFIVAFFTAYFLSRVPTFFILAFGHVAVCIAAVLYAVPIPPTTSYFAWGFWAMILSVVGADTAWPCLTLFTSHSLPKEDQAVGGALINSSGMIGRAISLAIATSIQSSVMAKERGVSVQDVGPVKEWDAPSLNGLRAGAWTNFGILFIALVLVVYTFRSIVYDLDLASDEAISKLAETSRVIINTIGPYATTCGTAVIRACAENGTDYVDCSGEPAWMRDIIAQYGTIACYSGSRIIMTAGWAAVPADLSVYLAALKLQRHFSLPTRQVLVCLEDVRGSFSGGSLSSLCSLEPVNIAPFDLSPVPRTEQQVAKTGVLPPPNAFDVQIVDEPGVLVASTHAQIEEAVVGRSWGLYAGHGTGFLSPDGYGEDFFFSSRMKCSNALSALMFRTSLSLVTNAITKIPPVRCLAARMFPPGTGPSEEARRSHYFKYRTLAIADNKGAGPVPKVEVKFAYGGDPYVFTGVALTQAALVLLQGVIPAHKRGGILTPAALGEEFVTRLKQPEAGVEIEVEVLGEQIDRL